MLKFPSKGSAEIFTNFHTVLRIECMKDYFIWFAALIGCIFVIGVVGFLAQGTDFVMFRFFAPRYEQARRETFEQSKAYNEGTAQELEKMMLDYKKSKSDDEKQALKSVILHRSANFNLDSPSVSYELRSFVTSLLGNN